MGDWSEDELTILRTQWLLGMSDHHLISLLPNRSEKAIAAKRRVLKLTMTHHPDRPVLKLNRSGRPYSDEENQDILARYNNGESLAMIAQCYRVSERAIECKIERLLDRATIPQPKTQRRCLSCGNWFVSKEPKSINRRCCNCNAAMNETGASFLTVY